MTIYLYSMHVEQRLKVKQVYEFASDHLRLWFPLLPSYEALNIRINRLGETFKLLAAQIIERYTPMDCLCDTRLLDSMPIIICSGKREGKVAKEITNKGYCSTKGIYYYGLKLHALALQRPNRLPFPELFHLTPASENDLNLFKQAWAGLKIERFMGIRYTMTMSTLHKTERERTH